jgi:Putative quorum-sensing-regulated virulence factor
MTQDEIAAFNALPNEERLRQMFGDEIFEPARPYCNVRLPFGKYHGKRLDSVPVSYLYWMRSTLKDLRPWLRQAIDGYLKSFGLD